MTNIPASNIINCHKEFIKLYLQISPSNHPIYRIIQEMDEENLSESIDMIISYVDVTAKLFRINKFVLNKFVKTNIRASLLILRDVDIELRKHRIANIKSRLEELKS